MKKLNFLSFDFNWFLYKITYRIVLNRIQKKTTLEINNPSNLLLNTVLLKTVSIKVNFNGVKQVWIQNIPSPLLVA